MLSYRKLKPEANLCNGVRPGHQIPCNGALYQCSACGNSGCRQTYVGSCTEQGFDVKFTCLRCGAIGKQELVA
ncbi:MAG: hypothetical protein AB7T07_02565 [Steroidobacteraceae bacterium]